MTFIVSNFKSRVRDWMRPYTYNVVISPPTGPVVVGPGARGAREIELRTEEIALPGASFATIDNHKPYGNGLMLTIPHSSTIQEIACVHNVDGDGNILQQFYDWANSIVNIDGDQKFATNYLDTYTRDMLINIYDLDGRRVKRYKLNDAYPLSYDQVQMSWGGTETVKLAVNYRFRNYTVN